MGLGIGETFLNMIPREYYVDLRVFLPGQCIGLSLAHIMRNDASRIFYVSKALKSVSTGSIFVLPVSYQTNYILRIVFTYYRHRSVVVLPVLIEAGRKYLRICTCGVLPHDTEHPGGLIEGCVENE